VQTVGSAVAFLASTKEEIASISSGNVQAQPTAPAVVNTPQQSSVATTNIDMPALSSTMKEGKIVAWNKKVGDKVNVGDVLLVVESDKADMDVEAFEEGYGL
jgi:pyruvate dehydrogenase E2 component (dihydrolipoamide acetyltransferase)